MPGAVGPRTPGIKVDAMTLCILMLYHHRSITKAVSTDQSVLAGKGRLAKSELPAAASLNCRIARHTERVSRSSLKSLHRHPWALPKGEKQ